MRRPSAGLGSRPLRHEIALSTSTMPLLVRQTAGCSTLSRTAAALALIALAAAGWSQDWPQFRGPNRDGVVQGKESLPAFPAGGPELVWDRSVGPGFSAPAVAGERLLLFHRQGDREVVEALRAANGETIWKFAYETTYKDDFGFENGPRATPVIANGRVYTFGAAGVMHSLDLETGTKLWSVDAHPAFAVRKGFFGAASTPLVLGGKVIANIGGSDGAGIVAFDADSGAKLWTATDHEASYSSPVAARIDGAIHAIFFTREGLVALKPETGNVAYERRWRSRSHASVNAATPVVLGDIVFLSSSYGTGAIAMRLRNGEIEVLWSGEDVIDNHYSSCVRSGSTLFGFHGRQEYGQSFRAADLITGKVLWSSERMPAGSATRIGNRLLLLLESGELLVAAASREKFEVLARAQILGRETRAFPAVASGLLFARDKDMLVCMRLWPE